MSTELTQGARLLKRGDTFDPECHRTTHRLARALTILRAMGIEPTYAQHSDECLLNPENRSKRIMQFRGEPAPPFKIDGRHGAALRYTARDGRVRRTTGRRSFVYGRVFVDALLTGQAPDGVYEMQVTRDGPWHRLTLTPEEAAAGLASHPLSRGRLKRLSRRRDYVLADVV